MSKRAVLMSIMLVLAIALAWNPIYSQTKQLLKKDCCIAGNYKGFHQDLASPTCKDPEKGPFKMVIYQDKMCGSRVWGTVQGENPEAMKFEGTVTKHSKGCCLLTGKIWEETRTLKPAKTVVSTQIKKPFIAAKRVDSVEIKAVICKKGGKWIVTNGKYKHSEGCNGTFTLEQIVIVKPIKPAIK